MCHKTILNIARTPHHVVQRRNDGTACFFADDDYLVYLDYLKDAAEHHRCAIHAYVLMPEQVQLLVSPDAEHRLSLMMRGVGARYVEYVNYIYQRNGAFWERGLKSTPIGGERNLLACYRSIESIPVRQCLAASPADYRWSSYNHHAHGREDTVIRDHPSFLRLGAAQRERQLAYHEWFHQPFDDRALAGTGSSVDRGFAPGGGRFQALIERLAQRAQSGGGGRPRTAEHAAAAA
jgi:putative transposase